MLWPCLWFCLRIICDLICNLICDLICDLVYDLNLSHNGRERGRNATCIVDMKGPTTYLTDPEAPNEDPRQFSFDFSYWSHDGSKADKDGYYAPDTSHPNGKKFCDQVRAFFLFLLALVIVELLFLILSLFLWSGQCFFPISFSYLIPQRGKGIEQKSSPILLLLASNLFNLPLFIITTFRRLILIRVHSIAILWLWLSQMPRYLPSSDGQLSEYARLYFSFSTHI